MSAPNILNISEMYGNTSLINVTTTETTLVSNPINSNSVYKINTIFISNIDGANTTDVTVRMYRNSIGYGIANTVAVPADSTLVVISKDTSIYLQEDDSIKVNAVSNNRLHAICSFEIIK